MRAEGESDTKYAQLAGPSAPLKRERICFYNYKYLVCGEKSFYNIPMNCESSCCVIISAAEIKNYKKIKTFISGKTFIIACDGGLKHLKKLGLKADLIIGDFDSFKGSLPRGVETISLPCEKDDTDTFFAVKEGLKRGFRNFILTGVIGQRFDHSLCNLSALLFLFQKGAKAKIIDDYSSMEVAASQPVEISYDECSYFSLMCLNGPAEDSTITNAKYSLEKGKISPDYQYGISNEVLKNKKASVTVGKGCLCLIKIW